MILVIGASGIIGQHLRLTQPVAPVRYTAREPKLPGDLALHIHGWEDVAAVLEPLAPQIVINLSGENRPDVVEKTPETYDYLNAVAPGQMAAWCLAHQVRFIQVSSQGVLGGHRAPYGPDLPREDDAPVNAYGWQKLHAEFEVLAHFGVVARLTFVLGIRPFPYVGRGNPLEQMLSRRGSPLPQVSDRIFSVAFASDAALELWDLALSPQHAGIYHIGLPTPTTRADIAAQVLTATESPVPIQRVRHDEAFPVPAWAPRPFDTTFATGTRYRQAFDDGLRAALTAWRTLLDYTSLDDRAIELGVFCGLSQAEARAKLAQGFGPLHQAVAADFRAVRPVTDEHLLAWYRQTEAYLWELSAYHLDPGFNYAGMCEGIIHHLRVRNRRVVLCLGDGIGDLSLWSKEGGLRPIYHDLAGSRTAAFADFRAHRRFGQSLDRCETPDWTPTLVSCEAVIALDFFEHLPNVEAWAAAVFQALLPGGLFLAQNAFAIGDDAHEGSIPCHLVRNNRFVTDWEPLLKDIGFVQEPGGWWQRP